MPRCAARCSPIRPACSARAATNTSIAIAPIRVDETGFAGLLVIEPKLFADDRGFFLETFHAERYRAHGITEDFVQDDQSRSRKGVLRGLHFQVRFPQAQLLTVMSGKIFDVTVDLGPGSATFGRWFGVELSDRGPRQIYMTPGFGHGFCMLSEHADLHYKVSRLYDHGDEGGIHWNDPDVGIRWPIAAPTVSPRDGAFPKLRDLGRDRLPHC
ncbi:MAG: dTDP-4-dehydrorhamnose 3,5-epimerase [Xanthobacteraceae bacterium]